MALKELMELPRGLAEAGAIIAGLDRCFLVGFGRLGPEQQDALQSLARVCSGTPLAQAVDDGIEALARHEFVERHFVALAAARAALQGAQYDALRARAAQALGRAITLDAPPANTAAASPAALPACQESTRHWLMELALAGFRQLDYQALAPFMATLEQLQGEPTMTRMAALLTGFLHELLEALPIASLPSIPIYRWVDLWSRAMIGSLDNPGAPTGEKVEGTLTVLGVDLRHHEHFASLDVYALLERQERAQAVRITLCSWKVDVVHGSTLWQCFHGKADALLRAVSQHIALRVRDMTLLPTGDLLWDGAATPGKAYSLLEAASQWLAPGAVDVASWPSVQAIDRHPVQLAEPVYLEGYRVRGDNTLEWEDGTTLAMATARISPAAELQTQHMAGSTALVGLLRFDGGQWSVQPLAVKLGGKKVEEAYTGSSAYEAARQSKDKTLATLRERASRLLRKKS